MCESPKRTRFAEEDKYFGVSPTSVGWPTRSRLLNDAISDRDIASSAEGDTRGQPSVAPSARVERAFAHEVRKIPPRTIAHLLPVVRGHRLRAPIAHSLPFADG